MSSMQEGPTLKRKVAVKLTYNDPATTSSTSSHRATVTNLSRPSSPTKSTISAYSTASNNNFKPKAKVNSSATTRKIASTLSAHRSASSRNTASPVGTTVASTSSTPRAGSPAKLVATRVRNGALSPTFQPKAESTVGRSNLRPSTPNSVVGTLELRNRSLTTSSDALRSDSLRTSDASRSRHGSVSSLHHAVSFSALQSSNKSSLSPGPRTSPLEPLIIYDQESDHPPVRVKAKVSGMARYASESPAGSANSPSHLSTRLDNVRVRAPSISSGVSVQSSPPSSSPHTFYPITTATPAANPHRFAPSRPGSSSRGNTNSNHFQGFNQSYDDDARIHQGRLNATAKVDPAFIPLPPHSPPTSALSFSSHSSVSRSSVSYGAESAASQSSMPTTHQNGSPDNLHETLDNLVRYSAMNPREDNYSGDSGQDRETDVGHNNEERKIKAEAKSNRKIADLEITNRSLLAINASLETTKNRQAKEIRELRRKLRESRLILPPRDFKAVRSSLEHDDTVDEDEDEESEDGDEPVDGTGDETYKRINVMLDALLETGKRALETTLQDFPEGARGGAKVLTAEEVRSWRDSSGDMSDHEHETYSMAGVERGEEPRKPPLPSQVMIPNSDTSLTSEDEVEAMTLSSYLAPPSPKPPPILITDLA
ncbi:hypothetical protein BDQ12DRAFT_645116 [Crucibulum laeve]|uniref:Uncharacterized protein n=1 Tax=Crucibulum laeve TaxID=68775 RepID=A0A5C3M8T0_9AGAR|nr:hypothetical protein BDQ12DRAFT_645116 [Crucibulum laeve]